ncbi:hypothetical protein OROHE_017474 [Orobanche hederae]
MSFLSRFLGEWSLVDFSGQVTSRGDIETSCFWCLRGRDSCSGSGSVHDHHQINEGIIKGIKGMGL